MNDELLIKFLLKETSSEEHTMVQNWLLDEGNATYFAQFERIWNASEDLIEPNPIHVDDEWLKFKAKTAASIKAEPVGRPLKRNYTWIGIAAALVIAIGTWSIFSLFGLNGYTELASHDEVITKVLPDGSELTINKNTEMSYASNFKRHRKIQLNKGDVFFNIAHDKQNPFVIEIDKINVRVVGTSFNVKHLKNETEVVVESGIVKVSLNNQQIELVKGERVLISPDTKKLMKERSNDQLYNYYRTKLFIAVNTPLSELIEILNEAYGSNVVIADDAKQDLFNSTLELNASLEENLKVICGAMNLKISRNQQEILLAYK